MPLGTEFQPNQKDWLSSNDKLARDTVGVVVSRGAFGLNTVSVTATGALDYHYSTFLVDSTAGALTLTLPFANTLSTTSGSTAYVATKAIVLYMMVVAGTSNVTLVTQGTDTINGISSLILFPGDTYELISDGSGKWYAVNNSYVVGDGSSSEWAPAVTFVTPGDLNVTYSNRAGTYTRIGRVVFAMFRINTSSFTYTTSAGALNITGLPYTSANVANAIWSGATVWGGITKAGYGSVVTQVVANSSVISFVASGSGVAASNVVTTDIPSGSTVILRGLVIYHI